MIAQNKKNVKETAYRKEQEKFPAPIFYILSPSLFTLYPSTVVLTAKAPEE